MLQQSQQFKAAQAGASNSGPSPDAMDKEYNNLVNSSQNIPQANVFKNDNQGNGQSNGYQPYNQPAPQAQVMNKGAEDQPMNGPQNTYNTGAQNGMGGAPMA